MVKLFLGISKKVIFLSLLFFNYLNQSKAAEIPIIDKISNRRSSQFVGSKILKGEAESNSKETFFRDEFDENTKYIEILKKNLN